MQALRDGTLSGSLPQAGADDARETCGSEPRQARRHRNPKGTSLNGPNLSVTLDHEIAYEQDGFRCEYRAGLAI